MSVMPTDTAACCYCMIMQLLCGAYNGAVPGGHPGRTCSASNSNGTSSSSTSSASSGAKASAAAAAAAVSGAAPVLVHIPAPHDPHNSRAHHQADLALHSRFRQQQHRKHQDLQDCPQQSQELLLQPYHVAQSSYCSIAVQNGHHCRSNGRASSLKGGAGSNSLSKSSGSSAGVGIATGDAAEPLKYHITRCIKRCQGWQEVSNGAQRTTGLQPLGLGATLGMPWNTHQQCVIFTLKDSECLQCLVCMSQHGITTYFWHTMGCAASPLAPYS